MVESVAAFLALVANAVALALEIIRLIRDIRGKKKAPRETESQDA